jgi:hypothetical protein
VLVQKLAVTERNRCSFVLTTACRLSGQPTPFHPIPLTHIWTLFQRIQPGLPGCHFHVSFLTGFWNTSAISHMCYTPSLSHCNNIFRATRTGINTHGADNLWSLPPVRRCHSRSSSPDRILDVWRTGGPVFFHLLRTGRWSRQAPWGHPLAWHTRYSSVHVGYKSRGRCVIVWANVQCGLNQT